MLDFSQVCYRGPLARILVSLSLISLLSGATVVSAPAQGGAGAPIKSLDDCLRLALDDSPRLQISDERRDIASQGIKSAYGAFLPGLGLSRNWNNFQRKDFNMPVAGETLVQERATSKSWSARVDLNVFSGFSKFSQVKSAKNDLRAAEATHGYTRELVAEVVITAYFNLLRYKELLQVAVETRDQAAKELERTETYFRLGSSAKSDVLQQRVRLENTKLDLVIADNNVKMAFADLAFAMNQPLAETFTVDDSELSTDYSVNELDALYKTALETRLDLLSSGYSAEARRKDVGTARAGLYPSVSAFGNYSRTDNSSDERWSLTQSSSANSFGYAISWNVFDRMQTLTNVSRAKANARIAKYELEQSRMNVQVEIRQLHNSQLEARERANVSRETILQSAEELRLAQERFRVGAGTTLDVIVAQVNLASSRAQEVQAKCDFLIAKAKMNRAVGRLNPGLDGR
ncbi:MAG: TolC family protein [Gemmatimonadales bacterium]|nr:TolC family protein [Gemmatimonadales bacterium]